MVNTYTVTTHPQSGGE